MGVDETDIDDAIEDVLDGPRRVQSDMGSVENHDLKTLEEMRLRRRSEAALGSTGPQIMLVRMMPPGAQG